MTRILVVCMGNICRSPLASAVLHALAEERGRPALEIDSAGTYGGHAGEMPDPRARAAATARGYRRILQERARRVVPADFGYFDLILAMDRDNLRQLQHECPPEYQHKLHLFLAYANLAGDHDMPDPYYGRLADFERVLDLCEAGAQGVLGRIAPNPSLI